MYKNLFLPTCQNFYFSWYSILEIYYKFHLHFGASKPYVTTILKITSLDQHYSLVGKATTCNARISLCVPGCVPTTLLPVQLPATNMEQVAEDRPCQPPGRLWESFCSCVQPGIAPIMATILGVNQGWKGCEYVCIQCLFPL